MWALLMLVLAAVAAASAAYMVRCFHRMSPFERLARRHRLLSWLLACAPVAALGLFALINVTTMIVVALHLVLGWLICNLAARVIGKLRRRPVGWNARGVAAVALTAVYLGFGWYMAHHVFVTEYALTTEKDLGQARVRVAVIADSHLGITLDGAGFAEQMARVQAAEPDVVVLVGDFVDDDTDAADMREACEALGRLDAPWGVYFVFGNHDEGYFHYRNFTSAELRAALRENGVTILEDDVVPLGERLCLVGRKDRSFRDRAPAQSLAAEADADRYVILLDHQPNDYDNEAVFPVDLVLSGHTHGGHIFPAGQIGLLFGANDRIYGTETRGGTTFIVTSGISGWAIPFKTGTFSEFVLVDITRAAG